MESDTFLPNLIVVIVLVLLLVLAACAVYPILKNGPCGPSSLLKVDILAFTTFADLYFESGIEVVETTFKTTDGVWCWVRAHRVAIAPANKWSGLTGTASRGFMVNTASTINECLQSFQYRVWQRNGDFCVNFPVLIVAQEWRQWANEVLQHHQTPDVETKAEINQRLSWIRSACDLSISGVAGLRETQCWDDNEDLSLYTVLQDHVGKDLQLVSDRWDYLMLQVTFGDQLKNAFELVKRIIRSMLRLLETVLCRCSIRVASRVNNGEEPKDRSALDGPLYQMAKTLAECLLDPSMKTAPSAADLDATVNPMTQGRFDLPFKIKEAESADAQSLLETAGEKVMRDSLLEMGAGAFGLSQSCFEKLVEKVVFFFRTVDAVTDACFMVRFLARFSQLGGQMFLNQNLDREHAIQSMVFALETVAEAEDQANRICDIARTGWDALRRQKQSSNWCSTGPFDNFRIALQAKGDMHKIVEEVISILHELQGRANQALGPETKHLSTSMDSELAGYQNLWGRLKKRRGAVLKNQDLSSLMTKNPIMTKERL
ncbi:unnamed protein product [Polarella glacialis]|uniref:Uncharacterized protein n=1 Tax=Polarella glacialis TaxID=89957 RepID=A0A813HAX4_POLGL|nr:unnamed protein product [Polarella glacialis]